MPLNGIPISEDQCMGDSLPVMNAAFSALDAALEKTLTDYTTLYNTIPTFALKTEIANFITLPEATATGNILTYSNQTGTWVASAAPIDKSVLTPTGSVRLHSGVEIRWGTYTFTASNTVSNIVFSSPFPTAAYIVIPTAPAANVSLRVNQISTTGATLSSFDSLPAGLNTGYYVAVGS